MAQSGTGARAFSFLCASSRGGGLGWAKKLNVKKSMFDVDLSILQPSFK
jgi:hypothetical protein